MSRVFLFNPPTGLYRRDNRCQNRVEDQTVNVVFPPMELLVPAAVLEREGHQVWVRDYPAQHSSWKDVEADLAEIKPNYVIFTTTLATLDNDLVSAEIVKEHSPNAITAAKGEPLYYLDDEIIQKNPSLDIILRGEPDAYIGQFVSGDDWNTLPAVTFIQNQQIVKTNQDTPLLDLDTLPTPARHLIDNSLYRSPESKNLLTTVVTSLGCPYKCIFCSVPALTGTNVRYRSPENVVAELEECMEKHGIHEFLFHADTFTLNKRWVIDLCRLIVKKQLNIRWGCNSRVDSIDEERLIWMKRAGCWVVGFGVESGNDEHLNAMKKGATAKQARDAVLLCRKHDIRSHAFFVFGFPWDTRESIQELLKFASDLDPDFFDFNVAYPLPGTELDTMVEEKGLIIREKQRHGGYAVGSISTHSLDAAELEQWRRKALWKMYLRPHYIIRTLWNAKSPAKMLNYICAAGTRVKNLLGFKKQRIIEQV
jgi:anaerobic magnesium-protoporphyrin IX monomethyl ester cyclase